jgi:site-specific DNA-methyltransferase (adenine-specific)
VILCDGLVDLRLGRWQDVLADVTSCDAVISDPPFSARTHAGQRTGSSIRMPTIGYAALTETDAAFFAETWSRRARSWAILFCDHTAFRWHEREWEAQKWLAFAPLLVKQNPTPRFSGDGPAFGLEFILAARRRTKDIKPGSLPAYYDHELSEEEREATKPVYYETGVGSAKASDTKGRTVAGAKDLGVMRAIVRDYTRPGDLVVDPFAGGGTTALACAMEGRRCVTSEVDPKTHEIARARLAVGFVPDMFAGGGK